MVRRFVCVRQVDETDCGAAALATVARHYGLSFSLQAVRDWAGTDRVGTNLLGIVQAAERIGFSAKAVKGTFVPLQGAPLPAIAHVVTEDNLGHFVVVFHVTRNHVTLADPAKGIVKYSRDEFCQLWTGYLILLARDEHRIVKEADSGVRSPWRRFMALLSMHKGILWEGFACALLMTLLGISTSYFVQHLIDSVLVRGETKLLNALGIGMTVIILFRTLFGMLRHYLLAHLGRKLDLSLISGYMRHIMKLPMNFFEMRQVGEILSRMHDADKVREAVGGAALTAVVDGVLVLLTVSILWCYDFQLALVATLFAPLLLSVIALHHPATKRRAREAMEDEARLSAHLVEDISGVDTIKAYGAESQRLESGEQRLVKLARSIFSLQKLSISMSALGQVVSGLAGIVILWYGGHRVIHGAMTIGQLMFFYTLLGYMLDPLERLATINLQLQDALVAIDRLYQVIDIQAESFDDRQAPAQEPLTGIELRDVRFRYGCREDVLQGLNIRIPAGKTVAIVGESGCGKSTLLKLLTRFYDPSAGQVLLDGVDYRDLELASLRARIGLVSQEPFIFSGTVRENVAVGTHGKSLNEVIAACQAAGLDEFINGLPDRYETMIGERGANLSGGQRQRLAIARALLRQPDILLFDEATSHLDTTTERAIQENLRGVFREKTVVLVAHRLSTIRDADLIYVMSHGKVVEQGSHSQLMQLAGRYARLWRSQLESPHLEPTCPSRPHHINGLEAAKPVCSACAVAVA